MFTSTPLLAYHITDIFSTYGMVFTGLEYRVNDQSFLVEEPLPKPENTDKALLNPYSREIYLHKIEFKLLLHCVITRKVQN